MQKRKVQVTGGSSFIITLPKSWIIKHKIKKNQEIGLSVQPNGDLLLSTKVQKELKKSTKFSLSNKMDQDLVFRLLLSAYIAGYDEILVETKNEERIGANLRKSISQFNQAVTGFIIVQETSNSIRMKDTVNISEIPLKNSILRMAFLVKSMLKDTFLALERKDLSLCYYIIERDNIINASHWLILRQLNQLVHLKQYYMDLPPMVSFYLGLVSQYVERIGNQAVFIANQVKKLINLNSGPIETPIFSQITNKLSDLLNNALNRFFEFNFLEANSCIREGLNIKENVGPLIQYAKKNPIFNAPVLSIAEYFVRIGDIISNIGELTLDSYVLSNNIMFDDII